MSKTKLPFSGRKWSLPDMTLSVTTAAERHDIQSMDRGVADVVVIVNRRRATIEARKGAGASQSALFDGIAHCVHGSLSRHAIWRSTMVQDLPPLYPAALKTASGLPVIPAPVCGKLVAYLPLLALNAPLEALGQPFEVVIQSQAALLSGDLVSSEFCLRHR